MFFVFCFQCNNLKCVYDLEHLNFGSTSPLGVIIKSQRKLKLAIEKYVKATIKYYCLLFLIFSTKNFQKTCLFLSIVNIFNLHEKKNTSYCYNMLQTLFSYPIQQNLYHKIIQNYDQQEEKNNTFTVQK